MIVIFVILLVLWYFGFKFVFRKDLLIDGFFKSVFLIGSFWKFCFEFLKFSFLFDA